MGVLRALLGLVYSVYLFDRGRVKEEREDEYEKEQAYPRVCEVA